MESDLLIGEYERIRHILRDFYIFGCFTKDDYVEKSFISPSKYDQDQRKINAYLPEDFISKKKKNRKIIQFCRYNMYKDRENYIANTFRCRNFSELDIKTYFYVLQYLNEKDMGLSELCEIINDIGYGEVNDYQRETMRKKLIKFEEAEYITRYGDEKRPKYKLNRDILKDLSDDEIEDICIMLELVKNREILQVPFLFLQKKLELYLYCNRNIKNIDKDFFLYKHNHLFNVLDNEILLELLKAINNKSCVQITLVNNIENNDKGQECSFEVMPIKIIYDIVYGRQYLFSFSNEENEFIISRIDRIKKVETGEKIKDEELNEILKGASIEEKSWCTSNISESIDTTVKIEFKFDEKNEFFILERIKREGQHGKITKLEEGRYLFEIEVKDPGEMIPWIRSFGERAKIIESGDFKIEEKIISDWEELLKKYEATK